MANWFVPFKVESPNEVPFSVKNNYAKISGFDRVKLVYENDRETLIVWVTNDNGWVNGSHVYDTVPLTNGLQGVYKEENGVQMLSFRKDSVEFAIEYNGDILLDKEELVQVASSIY